MHKLLARQLRRHFGAAAPPSEWSAFLADVESAYQQADADRALLERSLELTSHELLERNATLRSILDSAPFILGVVEVMEDDLRYVNVNRATEKLWGKRVEELEGKRASEIWQPRELVRSWLPQYHEAARTQRVVQRGHELKTADGPRWHVYTVAKIFGRENHFCLIVEDATERPTRVESTLELDGLAPVARVLVIDDEESVGTAVRRILRRHEVVLSTSGRDALSRIETGETFDLVLCDLMMPHMTGMEVYREVQRVRPEMVERFVFITGGSFTSEARSFIESIPNRCMEKPFTVSELQSLVSRSKRRSYG